MVEETKDKGFVKDRETTLKEIEVKVSQKNDEQIEKIICKTGLGDITWKPKVIKSSFQAGIKITRPLPMEVGLLPAKLLEMSGKLSDTGTIKIKVSYNWWKTEQDGQPVTYRFILSEKMLNSWEVVKEETKEEVIAPLEG